MSVYLRRQTIPVNNLEGRGNCIDITVSFNLKEHTSDEKVTVVIGRPDSEEQRYADEDEAGGYSRIEDITPGKGQEDTNKKHAKEGGMTDEEFLNR